MIRNIFYIGRNKKLYYNNVFELGRNISLEEMNQLCINLTNFENNFDYIKTLYFLKILKKSNKLLITRKNLLERLKLEPENKSLIRKELKKNSV